MKVRCKGPQSKSHTSRPSAAVARACAGPTWVSLIPENWKVAPGTPFYKILVPTGDTVRYQWVVTKLLAAHKEVLVVGDSGVGKTFIMQEAVAKLKDMLISKVLSNSRLSSLPCAYAFLSL